ncbi:putative alkaline shock family protein YloU [Murinocardiopsis flavida]|uniref:Putative alkaline shock family protein YloU n=1 Tax=Murinocardiopsis flavida TaxID=645275 RepID=A0A2P8DF65_9ACTN|nr:Asp23/Gls24 family envelope stress response protein [Murinocardiopsis flavida]PSK95861.1 putative alkaline shock family protein YloU [Murinocardiopsis flavida]
MSADTAPGPVVRRAAPGDPAERGTTTVTDRVVAKVAQRAAAEVEGVCERSGRLGGLVGAAPGAAAVQVRRSGTSVTLRMVIAVRYPAPLRAVAREVRARVRTRVEAHTGLVVRHTDIEVGGLVPRGRAR